ncbi:MAG: NAD-dependent epimerase/dehydratase family protein [Elainella sp.]
MNIFVTGATGFLGRYTVAELLRRGHQVRAAVRSQSSVPAWQAQPQLQVVAVDLAQLESLATALAGVDVVIHLAAAKTGDWQTQYASTVTATKTLLQAMTEAQTRRLVAISTFSVYDYLHLPAGATLDETTALEPHPNRRDIYAQTKLEQEARFREFGQTNSVTILRPGIVYGRDALWNASLGAKKGNLWLQVGGQATLPLIYVENCAVAIANAVEQEAAIGRILNLVDDNLPTQQAYVQQILTYLPTPPRQIHLSWPLLSTLADGAWQLNTSLGGRLKLPGLLIPARLHARFKPLHYSNAQAKQILSWTPHYSLEAALVRSFGPDPLAAILPAQISSS